MANNPTKVKDPTEVALSAIQEALNINDGADNRDGARRSDVAPQVSSAPSVFDEATFDLRPGSDRPVSKPIG